MKRGKVIVEQVTKDGVLVEGLDQSLSTTEIYEKIVKYFPNVSRLKSNSKIMVGYYRDKKYMIRCKNITYLGNPHPHYKKRIQISDDLNDFYQKAVSSKAKPILLGIYNYENNTLFADFKIDTYIVKKTHNSSAHVYTSDLVAATEEGYFQKIDFFGNTITVMRPDVIEVYLNELFKLDKSMKNISSNKLDIDTSDVNYKFLYEIDQSEQEDEIDKSSPGFAENDKKLFLSYASYFSKKIVPKISDFFEGEKKEWNGIDCYKKMIQYNYRNKFQPEWAGFFLEFEFEKYLLKNELNDMIRYAQDKKSGGIDLDLYFPDIESYGDLKAHSEGSRGIQGNDWNTIFNLVRGNSQKDHVYYIVCEHSTEKDSSYNYEVTKFWNQEQNKTNLMSYSARMKHNIRLKKVYILDINCNNCKYLTKFKQGINSNGKPRAPKIMIEQENLQFFLVKQIEL